MSKPTYDVIYRYKKKAYDSVCFYVPKGHRAAIREHAEANGESMVAYIRRLIDEDMAKN